MGVIDPTPCAAKKKLGSCDLVDPTETYWGGGHGFKIKRMMPHLVYVNLLMCIGNQQITCYFDHMMVGISTVSSRQKNEVQVEVGPKSIANMGLRCTC